MSHPSVCHARNRFPVPLPAAQRGQWLFDWGRASAAGEAEPGSGPKGNPEKWVSVFAANAL